MILGSFDSCNICGDPTHSIDDACFVIHRKLHRQIGMKFIAMGHDLLHLAGHTLVEHLPIIRPELVGNLLGYDLVIGLASDILVDDLEQFLKP